MLWKSLAVVFVAIGLSVAVFSVYKASVDGLLQKLGLVGGDFSATVLQDKLSITISQINKSFTCDLPSRIRGTVLFMLSDDQEQGKLAFTLGNERIQCGAQIMAGGNVEVGTYEIIKGLGYLKQGYKFVQERAQIDNRTCEGLPEQQTTKAIEGILDATNGKVYQIIWNDWQIVRELAKSVDEICLDQRMKTR